MKSESLVELIEAQYELTQAMNHIPTMSIVGEQAFSLKILQGVKGRIAKVIIDNQGDLSLPNE